MSAHEKWGIESKFIPEEESAREKDFLRAKNNKAFFLEAEQKMPHAWAIQNSTLLRTEEEAVDNSYEKTFRGLLPENVNLKDYIETSLSERKGSAVAIDIGGLGSKLFSGFTPGFFERTAGVVLTDTRKENNVDPREDSARHHSVIEGDLFKQETRQRILDWLGGEKADLLFERMQGGLVLIPRDPRLVVESVRALYAALNDNGLMFLQTRYQNFGSLPHTLIHDVSMRAWKKKIDATPDSGLLIRSDEKSLLIQKLQNAPQELPHTELLAGGSITDHYVAF